MKLLLDTHALIWWVGERQALSERVLDLLENPTHELWVSSVSAYELSLKHQLGKLPEVAPLLDDYAATLRRIRAISLPITDAHALQAGRFSSPHRDPFDRLLAAQSLLEGIPLVSKDEMMAQFPIEVLW